MQDIFISMEIKTIESLLDNVSGLIKHKKKIEQLKGEKFNVFSILKMENKENETHSAFLFELLNPNGSHLKGNLFLKLFLETINDNSIDDLHTKVKTEYYIGQRNDIKKTGGRIDSYNSISIENKINAGDQNVQIERYCNHNKDKNTVYFLTKDGAEPSKKSKGDLVAGKDFFLLSYQKEIVGWLQLCMKECFDVPILRETIRQYIILIKKITNTMDKKEQQELIDLILKNSVASSFIASNYTRARQQLAEKVRKEVFKSLQTKLENSYFVCLGNNTSYPNSQIWIRPINTKESHLYFGVESFSGDGHFQSVIIGVFNAHAPIKTGYADLDGNTPTSKWWINVKPFDDFQDVKINFKNPETISRLNLDKGFRIDFVSDTVRQIIEYLDSETEALVKYIKRVK